MRCETNLGISSTALGPEDNKEHVHQT